MDTAMLFLGIAIGCLAGLLLAWWLARHGGAVEPFFLRLLRRERRATAGLDTRLMLHELLRQVEELNLKTQRMDGELQELRDSAPDPERKAVNKGEMSEKAAPFSEVYRLSSRGLTAKEIAGQLRLGQGEVDLLLSLEKKPSWVLGSPQIKVGPKKQF